MNEDEILSIGAENEKYLALLKQEQHRVEQLSMINEVQRCILSTSDYGSFLPLVVQILASHLPACDVAIYLSDELPDAKADKSTFAKSVSLKLAACAGEHGLIFAGDKEQDTCADQS